MQVSRKLRRLIAVSFSAGACALAPLAAQADAAACRALIGFDTAAGGVVTGGGAWETISLNAASFVSNNTTPNCEVKVVTSSGKGKPDKSVFLGGPMRTDQCSLYNYLSSIDSKLATAKTDSALLTAGAMVAKIDDLAATRKLVDPGYTDIRAAAAGLQECIVLAP